MKWGVALNVRESMSETLRKARTADRGGIDEVWITDFPASKYAPAVAAAVAEETKSCRIGVGLVSPLLYSPTQILQFMSTLSDTYGERFDLLLGPGDKHALKKIGISHTSRAMVHKSTQALQEIKTGLSETGHNSSIFLGAQGPRMIKASLKAHGVLLNYSDLEMAKWAMEHVKDECTDDFQIGLFLPTYVGDCRDFMKNQSISYSAAMVAIGLGKTASESFGFNDQIQRARRLIKKHGQINTQVVSSLGKELLQRFAFCGTVEQLLEYLKELQSIGFGLIVFGPPQGIRKHGVDIIVEAKQSFDMI